MTTLLYDQHCILCRQSVRIIRWLDWRGRVQPVALQDADYPDLDYETLMGALHVITRDQRILAGFYAMRYIARLLPLLWPILPLLYLPGMNWLGPRLYGWIARRRYAINRWLGNCEGGYCRP